ncbi:hypothetical protein NLX67_14180 [Domibacillus sp. A3M-37]|uniref:hypothetical protein n=1 Tax=Domibacillus sp. A3M-37 TaxID=2962037 RepID=UPI0020B7821B|nr:hypothetical protein [Domibacillus sp. A3M-37]MCP3763527.1 hypothetical protein [Domibacillus sp. A3M-37]
MHAASPNVLENQQEEASPDRLYVWTCQTWLFRLKAQAAGGDELSACPKESEAARPSPPVKTALM